MNYNIYRRKSKFYIVDENGTIFKDNVEDVKVNRASTSSTKFDFYSDDIGNISIDIVNIFTRTGLPFASANAFEYWADRNTGSHAEDENDFGNHASTIILETYGDVISIEEKAKDLTKFGENLSTALAGSAVMGLAGTEVEETFLSTNGITYVVSDDPADTMDLKLLEGHTIASGDLTFWKDTDVLTLAGQTPVALPTALARSSRARLSAKANGNIYFYEGGGVTGGVPNDADQVHMIITAGNIQTEKCATSISSVDYWLVQQITGSVLQKTAQFADFRIEHKLVSESEFYPLSQKIGAHSQAGTIPVDIHPYHIVRPNSDVRLWCTPGTDGIHTAGGIKGLLAKIIT